MSSNVAWRKSSYSGVQEGNCVEIADLTSVVAVRDSKDPDGTKLTLGTTAWRRLTQQIKNGDHDLA